MPAIDPFEVLTLHDPAADLHVDADMAMLASIVGHSTRRRRRLVLIAVAVVALLAAIAASLVLRERPVTNLSVTCYSTVGLDGDRYGTLSSGVPRPDDCREAWQMGWIESAEVERGQVPPLTACVTDTGGLAVFPTDAEDVCRTLGLAVRNRTTESRDARKEAQALDDLVEYSLSFRCADIDDMVAFAREVLDKYGLDDWRAIRRRDQPGRPCGSIAFDPSRKEVIIVPNETTSDP